MSATSSSPEPRQGSLAHVISQNVSNLMAQRRVSQQQLADAIGVPQTSIGKRLRGVTHWTADDMDAVAMAFDVPVSRLIEPAEEGDAPTPLRVVAHPVRSRRVTKHTHKYPTPAGLVTPGYGRVLRPAFQPFGRWAA